MKSIVKVKKNISLSIALSYLDGLYNVACDLLNDPIYHKLFNDLRSYVNSLYEAGINSDILEFYEIIEFRA